MLHAREFIHYHGGALYAPSWAKFWLAVIGVYEWEGINSIPVEMWLLPHWFPFHPSKLWCHCRMVYLPMGYIYCKRYQPDVSNDLTLQALRQELYPQSYNTIRWDAYRQTCAAIDEYSPLNPIMKVAQDFMSYYERYLQHWPWFASLRQAALTYSMAYIHTEDQQTNYIDIGPVNKALNMLAVYIEASDHHHDDDHDHHLQDNECFQRHLARVDDYLWLAEDGLKMQGYNGSQCWDTSFTAQAVLESKISQHFPLMVQKMYSYFNRTQIRADEADCTGSFRHISKGGWPFSTSAHGWPISDCTSEGLKAVLAIHAHPQLLAFIPVQERISGDRLASAVDILLSYQNQDGGWATYENNRGARWYELLNPSEVFGDIMIDYSYVECSSACMTAMQAYTRAYPNYRTEEIKIAMKRGRDFLKSIQRKDGSWYGSWGNCFTYGTWFGIEGLLAAGEGRDSFFIRRAVHFLLSKQNANGGWGESYLACVNKAYPNGGTGEVSTCSTAPVVMLVLLTLPHLSYHQVPLAMS
jgi:squalene/oxidosqualene cyclase-like protein